MDDNQLTMRPMPRSEPPPHIMIDQLNALEGNQTKSWQPAIQPTDEEIGRTLQTLDDLAAASQPPASPEAATLEQGEAVLSAEDLQGILVEEATMKPEGQDDTPAAQKPDEGCLFTLDKPTVSLDTSAVELAASGKDECLARLREVYSEASKPFEAASQEILQDAVSMLIRGEWIMDAMRLHKMLHIAIPAFDPGHFNQDIKNVDNTRVLVRAIMSALTRNFKDDKRVETIATKLQESNPYLNSDAKSSSGASPLPGTFTAIVTHTKKRHKGA